MSTPGSCLIHYEVSMKSYEVIPIQTISEYDSLIAQIRQLKQDIADLTAEKDDLEGHISGDRGYDPPTSKKHRGPEMHCLRK